MRSIKIPNIYYTFRFFQYSINNMFLNSYNILSLSFTFTTCLPFLTIYKFIKYQKGHCPVQF